MKLDISKAWAAVKGFSTEHSPAIFTGLGIAGMIFTVVEAVHATPKAMRLIEEKTADIPEPKPVDKVKACWKCYIPTAIGGATSITLLILANHAGSKRNAALSAAYTIAETTLNEYRHKVAEKFGNRKEESVRDDIAKDKLAANPVSSKEVIILKGETLCYDTVSGRYFRGDIETIRRARDQLNLRLRDEMFVSLNEFYAEIGLPLIDVGEKLGWNIDKGYIELQFTYGPAENEEPCLILGYDVQPYYHYI